MRKSFSQQLPNQSAFFTTTLPNKSFVESKFLFHSVTGVRESNEDKEVKFNDSDCFVAAIFDGHNGKFVSNFCGEHLQEIFMEKKGQNGSDYEATLHETIETLNYKLFDHAEAKQCGSTAIIAVLDIANGYLHIANVGDSRCLVGFHDKTFRATQDHKPTAPFEVERLERVGAEVVEKNGVMRVGGSLAVSRTIGDIDFKSMGVTCEADYLRFEREEVCYCLLGCDGLFDVISNETADMCMRAVLSRQTESSIVQVNDFIQYYNGRQDNNYQTELRNGRRVRKEIFDNVNTSLAKEKRIAQAFCKLAVLLGSEDNVSVGVCFV